MDGHSLSDFPWRNRNPDSSCADSSLRMSSCRHENTRLLVPFFIDIIARFFFHNSQRPSGSEGDRGLDIGRGGELCLMNPGASNAISTTTLIRRRWSPRRLPRRRQTLMSSPRPHCSRAYESPFSLRCDLIHVLRTLGRPGSVGPPCHPLARLQTTPRVSETPMEYLAIRCR